MKRQKQYLLYDQYGEKIMKCGTTPRQALIEYIQIHYGVWNPKLRKMYIDGYDENGKLDGSYYHVGYIYRERWFVIYEIIPMKIKQ